MEEIPKRIDQVCEAKRLNYKQLAEKLGVSPQSIYQLIKGKNNNPTVLFIEKFSSLGVNIAWLLTGEGEMMREKTPHKETVEINEIEPSFLLRQIEQKDSIIRTLQGIIDSQLMNLGKLFDVLYSRFVFFVFIKDKFRYIKVM